MNLTGTSVTLGGVHLYETHLWWPMHYRGARHVPVTFYQPGSMVAELNALPRDERGHELVIENNGIDGPKRTVIKGVFILDVQEIHDGPHGCRVTLADRRALLGYYTMAQNWNIVYQGRYLAGTANQPFEATTLLQACVRVFAQPPFEGFMHPDWAFELTLRADDEILPAGLLYGGQNLETTLEQMLDHWGYDLAVDPASGTFYVASRRVSATSDPGVSQLASRDLEWVDRLPNFQQASQRRLLPRYIRVKFHEDHNLAVRHYSILPEPFGAGTRGETWFRAPREWHGLALREVYQALGTFWAWPDLLRAYDYSPDAVGTAPLEYAHSFDLVGTALEVSVRGIASEEREKRFTLAHAIRESFRRFYAVIQEAQFSGQRFGPFGAWANLELGMLDRDGNVVATRAIGDWSELPEELRPPDAAYIQSAIIQGGGDPDKLQPGWIANLEVPLVIPHSAEREFTARITIRQRFEEPPGVLTQALRGTALGIARAFGPQSTRGGYVVLDPPLAERVVSVQRNFEDNAPFMPQWERQSDGILRMGYDRRRLMPGSDAVLGLPTESGNPKINALSPPFNGPNDAINRRKRELWEARQEVAEVEYEGAREDIRWERDYAFWCFMHARRMFPNDDRRFWIEQVSAFPRGDIEYMELEADDRVTARRDFVNYPAARVALIQGEAAGKSGPDIQREADAIIEESLEKDKPDYSDTGSGEPEGGPVTGPQGPVEERGSDGFGRILNRSEVLREARRRARHAIDALTEPHAWEHDFLAVDTALTLRLMGSLDSVTLKIQGSIVLGEVAVGKRQADMAQRYEAMLRAAQQRIEVGGKLNRR